MHCLPFSPVSIEICEGKGEKPLDFSFFFFSHVVGVRASSERILT